MKCCKCGSNKAEIKILCIECYTNIIHNQKTNRPYNVKQKIRDARNKALGRGYGFVPINDPFPHSEDHHPMFDELGNRLPDKNTCGWIPTWLHKSVWHNYKTGKGMRKIDTLFWEFINSQKREGSCLTVTPANSEKKDLSYLTLTHFTDTSI